MSAIERRAGVGVGGAGVLKDATGVYDGEWKDDKKNGRGEGGEMSYLVMRRGEVPRAGATGRWRPPLETS